MVLSTTIYLKPLICYVKTDKSHKLNE